MSDIRYSEDHEWIVVEGDIGTVGISDYAQKELGDVVYAEVPEAGTVVAKGDEIGVVESFKAVSELYSPVTGEVVEGNAALGDAPETVNADPLGAGWFFKIRLSDPGELDEMMDEEAYQALVDSLS